MCQNSAKFVELWPQEFIEGQFRIRQVLGKRIPHNHCECCNGGQPSAGCDCCSRDVGSVEKPEEKGSDVNLATRLVADGFKGLYDTALVVSGDSDLQLAVNTVMDDLGKEVIICDPRGRPSRPLRGSARRTIRESALTKCQLPIPVYDGNGKAIHPPAGWSETKGQA